MAILLNFFKHFILQRRLLNDPLNPQKYAGVLVSRDGYKKMEGRAVKAKGKTKTLLNDVFLLVFTREELASSTGTGKRNDANKKVGNPLDKLRLDSVKGKNMLRGLLSLWSDLLEGCFSIRIHIDSPEIQPTKFCHAQVVGKCRCHGGVWLR